MSRVEVVLTVVDVVVTVVAAFPAWGPPAVAVALGAVFLELWPTGRHRARTGARTDVRTPVDSASDTLPLLALTCADTRSDMSGETRPGVSGPVETGGR